MPEDILKLAEIRRRIDAAVQPAQLQRLKEISKQLNQPGYSCGYEVETLGDAIAFLSENRDRRSRENNVIARGAICIIDSLYRRLDAAGLPNLLSEIAPNFYQFNFVELGQAIDQELRLAHKAASFRTNTKAGSVQPMIRRNALPSFAETAYFGSLMSLLNYWLAIPARAIHGKDSRAFFPDLPSPRTFARLRLQED